MVTVVYNGCSFIEETIKSVAYQTYRNVEYIVIDGGSTDGTLDILRKYDDSISVWISEPDKGMYDALNKGFDMASGDIFAYINADDLYKSIDVFEQIVAEFKAGWPSLVFGNYDLINADGSWRNTYKSALLPRTFVRWLSRVPFAQQSAFWSKSAHARVGGFDSTLKYVADSKFFFELIFDKTSSCKKIDITVASFRWHDDGFSTKRKIEMKSEARQMRGALGLSSDMSIKKIFIESIVKIYNLRSAATKLFGVSYK